MRITDTAGKEVGGVCAQKSGKDENGSKNELMILTWLEPFHAVSAPFP